jgi:hypothetical protein
LFLFCLPSVPSCPRWPLWGLRVAESDDLITAYHEFDGLYSEEELRLVRIKFLSEFGN